MLFEHRGKANQSLLVWYRALPVIEDAYAKMRAVWESQQAGDKLETRRYAVPHLLRLIR